VDTDAETYRTVEEARSTLLSSVAPGTLVHRVRWSRGETEVLELGTGPPLLLVHGAFSDASVWAPIMSQLARHHRVLAVDLPGHGLADPFDYAGEDLFEVARTFLPEILDALEVPIVAIAANSMGGFWSVVVAIERPECVSRLVLPGAPLGVNLLMPRELRVLGQVGRVPVVGPALTRRMMAIPTREANRTFWQQLLVVHPERIDDALLDADLVGASRNMESHLSLLRRITEDRRRLVLGRRWQELTVPTLVLWGDRDRFFGGPRHGEAIAARNDQLNVIRIADAGHIVWIDDPERVVDEIDRFLGQEPAGRRRTA
jgi:pimeloyl-ACP methyl ester carboxylesterase